MDKKIKKRIQVLKDRLQKRRLQLAGALSQPDEPDEVKKVQRDIEKIEKELEHLKEQ